MNIPVHQFGVKQIKAYHTLHIAGQQIVLRHGLTPSQWYILSAVYDAQDGIRVVDISQTLSMEQTQTTMLAKRLEADGLITRRNHATDKRSRLLHVTVPGKQIVGEIEREMDAAIAQLFAGVKAEQVSTYIQVLDAIAANGQGNIPSSVWRIRK